MEESETHERKTPYTVMFTDKEANAVRGMTLARDVGRAVEMIVRTAMTGATNGRRARASEVTA